MKYLAPEEARTKRGIKTIRFTNEEVFKKIEKIKIDLEMIVEKLKTEFLSLPFSKGETPKGRGI